MSSFLLSSLFLVAMMVVSSGLTVDFYKETCPSAEDVIRETVNKALQKDAGLGAGLIRMHFHDCFVRGCDASVLLDSTHANTAEKDSPPNNPSLRGFEVIDEAKRMIESKCPQTVSCADIIAFAARDSALKLGNISYSVPAGRRDGTVSSSAEAVVNIPSPSFNLTQLQDSFTSKGLSIDDMVTLSGAHSIGRAHTSNTSTVPMEPATPNTLDNLYYKQVMDHKGLFGSDNELLSSSVTAKLVRDNAKFGAVWAAKFGSAMVRTGNIGVLTGEEGEIRKNCRVVN
ncbi:hypothetical protein Sjap_008928 [Stephania japonica]|uniref:Peroxidase n=1 Tax=Stephania japonica TaxID=461633 RepID=A0AAP0JR79_9MAGN